MIDPILEFRYILDLKYARNSIWSAIMSVMKMNVASEVSLVILSWSISIQSL